ncbi:nicotinate-nucleotide--dimethylbenzimidazole phosphoribosyltransferase [Curvibacter sp. HBC28]|uniref:Nicotinate-nucleotide--dimethylbenzimidazole phosphoribosyltransferase n=1 Tax=Curvibacter microcysteis TaxID=3026419 RepID=A0ABT5MKG6_9BURK|nr:nicotinate-nucleotide--dimethylbenzimidazole phosphoribosyltransferase [Curvibacter sp. HBC28]MDD0817091.1 nicotinate-nucleotide--dimethylbenzimidazole phosphoribosyltransferase [Curvibacter sp. HBC28]
MSDAPNFLTPWLPEVADLHDPALSARLQQVLDNKTKPLGSLGQLESLALQLGQILGTEAPRLQAPQMLVCAADHGLAARGVSAYPSDVTWQMVENFLAGGAAVSVLARQHGLALTVVDCGVRHDFGPRPEAAPGAARLLVRKVGPGTADASAGPAMSEAECAQAVRQGREVVASLPGNVLLLGEMGIGNTSAASLLLAWCSGRPVAECTGRGTGLDVPGVARKVAVLEQVMARHADLRDPAQALAALGGFELATLVGAVLQASAERRVVLVDGFITTAAVMLACALVPTVRQRCVFAHQSGERGHALMLQQLQAQPLLSLGLRLGEGSGAALAWPLLQSACLVLAEMASFASAGVSQA